jgi:hypothetical protein
MKLKTSVTLSEDIAKTLAQVANNIFFSTDIPVSVCGLG